MARLLVHRNILKNFHALPGKVQKRVAELIEEFQRDPQSERIGLHPLQEMMLDPKVRGVKMLPDGWRAIVIAPERGDTYLLVHIDSHDRAYEWARNKRFEVHEATGVFQVFDAEEISTAVEEAPSAPAEDYPLARLSEDDLFAAGVPRPLIPAVKSIRSDEALESLIEYLPPDCRDVLFGLASGMTLTEALEEMLGPAAVAETAVPAGPGDFSKIEDAPNFDLVLVEGQDELKRILAGSLQEWRVFLHPSQRKLVAWETRGPISVTGAAGTGKTVALMHRAVQLARRLTDPAARVLVTTFTTNLSVTIKHHIERLDPAAAGRIEVTNLHALARFICNQSGWKGRIADPETDIPEIWNEVWLGQEQPLPMSQEELRREYELVVDRLGIDDEEAYLSAVRSGRPPMRRPQRKQAWPIFRSFQRGLKKRNLLTFDGAIHQARLAIEKGRQVHYAHVLVDETQDFSLEALRLIAAISPLADQATDPLCLVGDGHQRIYGAPVPLSRATIAVRGRSRRLKVNYRTTEQIRKFAHNILRGASIDDLDEGAASTRGDHSIIRGPEPEIQKCTTARKEADAILAWVQKLTGEQKFATHEICVTPLKPMILNVLTSAGLPVYRLQPNEEDPGGDVPGIRLGSMARIKGLEFRAVAMACADAQDPMNHLDQSELRARCERYVAATRARERLLVTVKE